jgi:hypothetical protein
LYGGFLPFHLFHHCLLRVKMYRKEVRGGGNDHEKERV